jgi:anti-sigma regulatory factor (Ser/Thr protein kinase)
VTPDQPTTTGPPAAPAAPAAAGEPPAGVALEQTFDGTNLFALRSAVAAHGTELGLTQARVADLVLAAQELAANAVRHGGAVPNAPGRLRLWREDGRVVCEVADGGPGMADPDSVGTERAAIGASAGRGLWIVRQIVDTVAISSRPEGLTVTVTFGPG